MAKYAGYIIPYHGFEGSFALYEYQSDAPRMTIPGAPSVEYLFRGREDEIGFWIPAGWVDAESAGAAQLIESLRGQVKTKQKTISEQGDKIRTAIGLLHAITPEYGSVGLVKRVRNIIERLKSAEKHESARRDFVSRLFKLKHPGWAMHVSAGDKKISEIEEETVQWVQGLASAPKHMGLPERAEFDEIRAERDRLRAEAMQVRAELKSTGHQSEGLPLDILVDKAIDKERINRDASISKIATSLGLAPTFMGSTDVWVELITDAIERERRGHGETLDRISKALKQPWAGAGSSKAPYRDWCSFLINVITDHWMPKPRVDEITFTEVPMRTVDREEAKGPARTALDAFKKIDAAFGLIGGEAEANSVEARLSALEIDVRGIRIQMAAKHRQR